MSFSHRFTINRSAPPNRVALIAAVHVAVDPTVEIAHNPDGTYLAHKATTWTAQQIIDAQTAFNTCASDSPRLLAEQAVDAMSIFDKAIILTILDQFNFVRSKLVPPLSAITVEQMISAVRTKAGTL